MKLLLLRHGAVDDPADPPGGLLGRREAPLSATGREQARAWGRALAASALRPVSLRISPLGRARETARLLVEAAAAHGLRLPEIEAVPALAEIDLGAFDGLTREAVEARFPGAWAARGKDFANFRPPGGESFADLSARVAAWLDESRNARGPALAVTHGGVIRSAVCLCLGLPLGRVMDLGAQRGSLTILELAAADAPEKNGRNRLLALNLPAGSPI